MRYRFHTLSGAFYIIDEVNLTWERHTPRAETPKQILGLEETSGKLKVAPVILIGYRGELVIDAPDLPAGYDRVFTTPVQRIELLDG